MARRRSRAGRVGCAAVATLALLAAAVALVVLLLDRADQGTAAPARCVAEVDGTAWFFEPVQAENAALVSGIALQRGLPARAVTIALATALQESQLINIDHGDRDSIGLFQQRPSQGWGTVEQIMDPVYSTGAFYDGLVRVEGYEDMPITEAAQAVQRSAFPEAYAQHEGRARAWASGLTGWSPAAITCSLHAPTAPGDVDALTTRLARDLGELPVTAVDDMTVDVDVDAAALGPETARMSWAVASWAVAVADAEQVTSVAVADQVWHRDDGAWLAADERGTEPVPSGHVRITLAGEKPIAL